MKRTGVKQLFCLLSLIVLNLTFQFTYGSEVEKMNNTTLIHKIEQVLSESEMAIQQQEWQRANLLLKQGIAELGDQYLNDNNMIEDNTGMKLFAANDQERNQALSNAAEVRERILRIRLDLYKQKMGVVTDKK